MKTPLQLTACTSVCLRCITKLLAQCQRTVPVNGPIQHPAHTISHRPHLYLRNATAHLAVLVTGIATAWRESILAKLRAMPTPYDTLRSFASCMTSDIHYSVQMDRSGWMVFVNAFRSFLCHCCVRGQSQRVKRYERRPLLLTLHATCIRAKACHQFVISVAGNTSRSSGPSRALSLSWTRLGSLSRECGT